MTTKTSARKEKKRNYVTEPTIWLMTRTGIDQPTVDKIHNKESAREKKVKQGSAKKGENGYLRQNIRYVMTASRANTMFSSRILC